NPGRSQGNYCRRHYCAPVGRIVAEIVVDPQGDRLDAGAVEHCEGEDEVPPAGQEREDRDRDDSRAREWDDDETERLPLGRTGDSGRIKQLVREAEEERA